MCILFSLTVHCLKPDFTISKMLFGVTEITGSCKSETIKETLTDYIEFAKLDMSKITCIVRDDATNVKKASKLLGKPSYVFFNCLGYLFQI